MTETLIVYYSRTGRTRMVAEKLGALLGADVEEIREAKKRSGLLGAFGAGKDTVLDRPAELTAAPSAEGRRTVVVGMPVWADKPPPAVRAYLEAVDLAGKAVCAFCTHGGGGGKKCFAALSSLLPAPPAETAEFKRPKPDDADLAARLSQWAEKVRAAGTG